MSVEHMQSYKATCDEEGCGTYLNFTARMSIGAVSKALQLHKWWIDPQANEHNPPKVRCPKHAEEHK